MQKKSIPTQTKLTITRPPRPPECQSTNNKSGNEHDEGYVFQNMSQAQEAWRQRKNQFKVNLCSLEFLHLYNKDPEVTVIPKTSIILPHKNLHKINQARKRNRKEKKKCKL